MPITASRMSDLISAAAEYQQAFNKIVAASAQVSIETQRGGYTYEQAFKLLVQQIEGITLSEISADSLAIIAVERQQLRRNAHRNARERARQERKRRALGRAKVETAPPTLVPGLFRTQTRSAYEVALLGGQPALSAPKLSPAAAAAERVLIEADAANEAAKLDMLRRGLDPMNGHPFESPHAHHLALIKAGLFAELARLQSEEDDGYAFGEKKEDI